MKCEICGKEMFQIKDSDQWYCWDHKDQWQKHSEPGFQRYVDLAEDKSLWLEEIFDNAPSVIAYEYYSLREMLRNKQIQGLPIMVKDVWETLIRFSSLCLISREADKFIHGDDTYIKVLAKLQKSKMSMGDWEELGDGAYKIEEEQGHSQDLLCKVQRILEGKISKYNVVNWRNKYVGHGSILPIESDVLYNEIRIQLKGLYSFFNETHMLYNDILLLVRTKKDKSKYWFMKGHNHARNLKCTGGELFVKQGGEKPFRLLPFIRNFNHGIYFYDTYDDKTSETIYRNYMDGNIEVHPTKSMDELLQKIRQSLKVSRGIKYISNGEIKDGTYEQEYDDMLTFLQTGSRKDMEALKNKIQYIMEKYPKGIFVLKEYGSMAAFAHAMEMKKNKVLYRIFVASAVYHNTSIELAQHLYDKLRSFDRTNFEQPAKQWNSINVQPIRASDKDADQQVVELFQGSLDYYRVNNNSKTDIVFFITGLEEVKKTRNGNILDILPQAEKLPNHVYIILGNYGQYMTQKLKDLHVLDVVDLDFDNNESISVADDYHLKKYNLKNKLQKILQDEQIHVDIDDQNIEMLLSLIPNDDALRAVEKIFEEMPKASLARVLSNRNILYWEVMERQYGKAYTEEILRVAMCLNCLPFSKDNGIWGYAKHFVDDVKINVFVLSGMLGKRNVTFEFLMNLYRLQPILKKELLHNDLVLELEYPMQINEEILQRLYVLWKSRLEYYVDVKKVLSDEIRRSYLLMLFCWLSDPKNIFQLDEKFFPSINKLFRDYFMVDYDKMSYWQIKLALYWANFIIRLPLCKLPPETVSCLCASSISLYHVLQKQKETELFCKVLCRTSRAISHKIGQNPLFLACWMAAEANIAKMACYRKGGNIKYICKHSKRTMHSYDELSIRWPVFKEKSQLKNEIENLLKTTKRIIDNEKMKDPQKNNGALYRSTYKKALEALRKKDYANALLMFNNMLDDMNEREELGESLQEGVRYKVYYYKGLCMYALILKDDDYDSEEMVSSDKDEGDNIITGCESISHASCEVKPVPVLKHQEEASILADIKQHCHDVDKYREIMDILNKADEEYNEEKMKGHVSKDDIYSNLQALINAVGMRMTVLEFYKEELDVEGEYLDEENSILCYGDGKEEGVDNDNTKAEYEDN